MVDNGYRLMIPEEQFDPRIVEETRMLMSVIWKKSIPKAGRIMAMRLWTQRISDILEIPKPIFVYINDFELHDMTGGALYLAPFACIQMTSISLVSLLHEFRHHIQNVTNTNNESDEVREEDARAWSCSLFNVADPAKFENAMSKGILKFC